MQWSLDTDFRASSMWGFLVYLIDHEECYDHCSYELQGQSTSWGCEGRGEDNLVITCMAHGMAILT